MLRRNCCPNKNALLALKVIVVVKSSYVHKSKCKLTCQKKKNRRKHRRRKRKCFPIFPCPPKCKHKKKPIPKRCFIPICTFPVTPVPPVTPITPITPIVPVVPITPIVPVIPVDPPIPSPSIVVEKECCGNILIQGIQPPFLIWEADVDAAITVAQLSIYCDSSSTDALEVEIEGAEKKHLSVSPGNTNNYIGQGITSIRISSKEQTMTYVEGKYVISTTLQLQAKAHEK
ncbi:S-Ena type endospore appendage [Paenibacillus alba]|uniref:S-Ena type endospore appendage n=1 Tax=Paenibacillus alba TaxID=1197127 RepID=UPI002DBE6694|nr:S-Ena type endospore appendage [Paenibacillus alba]